MKKLHFISGLPKSGSSLLGKLLDQDPDVTVAPCNTACNDILYTVRNHWKKWKDHAANPELASDDALKRVLHGILSSYCNVPLPVHFDKGRSWLTMIEMLEFALDREVKIIVPVRSVKDIVASLELEHRKNIPYQDNYSSSYETQDLQGRVNKITSESGELGVAYRRLQDAIQRGMGSRLFIADYDDVVRNPEQSMKAIWEWLDMDAPEPDYSIIEKTHDENFAERILGKEICQELEGLEFWRANPSQRQTT